jgi:hypothetical protein
LPPVSATLAKVVEKFATSGIDTGGNFTPLWQIFPPVWLLLLITVANLPTVSLKPVVHLDLRISQQVFEKI